MESVRELWLVPYPQFHSFFVQREFFSRNYSDELLLCGTATVAMGYLPHIKHLAIPADA